jgi:glutamate carboxypeptidase
MKTVAANKILQYLETQKSNMEKFVQQLVSIETPSNDKNSQDKIFKVISDKLANLDYATWRNPGVQTGGYIIGKPQFRQKNKAIQLLIGHCDTVWEKDTIKKMPIRKVNGQLTGPGVFDMKAGLTQMLFALQTIRELDLPLELTPVCLVNSDEEIGSKESTTAIRRLSKIASRAYVLEPPLGLDGKLKTTRKGLGRFTVTVKGKAAHAGLNPQEGVSAILELSHVIQELFAMNNSDKGITVNVGMIEGGTAANVIAPLGRAVADVRVPTIETAEIVSKKIFALKPVDPNIQLSIEGGFGRLPMERTKRNQKLFAQAQMSAEAIGLMLNESMAGGGSDANTTSLYTATLDGLGTAGDGAHALHEFIFMDSLIERTGLLTLLLLLPENH